MIDVEGSDIVRNEIQGSLGVLRYVDSQVERCL